MNLVIRNIRADDRDVYLEMSREFYRSEAVSHDIPATFREKTFDEYLRSDVYTEGLMLEYDGKIVGYGVISKTWSQECGGIAWWLEELYLLPRYRSMGIAHEYFRYIFERAEKEQVCRLRLEVEPDNTRAEKLYREMGFTELGYKQMIKELC